MNQKRSPERSNAQAWDENLTAVFEADDENLSVGGGLYDADENIDILLRKRDSSPQFDPNRIPSYPQNSSAAIPEPFLNAGPNGKPAAPVPAPQRPTNRFSGKATPSQARGRSEAGRTRSNPTKPLGINQQQNAGSTHSRDRNANPANPNAKSSTTPINQPQNTRDTRNNNGSGPPHKHERSLSQDSKKKFTESRTKAKWAEPSPLVKTRVAKENAKVAEQLAVANRYINTSGFNRDYFSVTGYYMWEGNGLPADILGGIGLSTLDHIRTTWQVYVDWDSDLKALRVSAERRADDEDNVTLALAGIRQAIKNEKAAGESKNPLFIVVPPSPKAMRSIVAPMFTITKEDGKTVFVGTKLEGDYLSGEEEDLWSSAYNRMLAKNQDDFKTRLSQDAMRLIEYKQWMRMRVHFGRVHLERVQASFANSECSFERYVKMINSHRVVGSLDRKFEGSFATELTKRILKAPETYRPGSNAITDLEKVEPKHTEIIFVQPKDGQQLRLEAEIDFIPEFESDHNVFEAGTGTGQYQMGAKKLYQGNARNGRVEITVVDIEKGFDWVLELIEDSQIPNLSPSMIALANSSVSNRTRTKKDALGLAYPGILPKIRDGAKIDEVVLRSVYSYTFGASGYVVDISVFRTWLPWLTKEGKEGPMMGREPHIQSSMSMYHHDWDWMTAELYDTEPREWDTNLDCFFDRDTQRGGIPGFLEDVKTLQDLLRAASQPETSVSATASEN